MNAGRHRRYPRHWWLVAVMVAMVTVVAGCAADDDQDELTVFAAASLRGVLADLEGAWLAQHPDVPLTVATEASNVLAAQIREGAPADVFLSADTERPAQLAEQGHTAALPVTFARNRLALVVPDSTDAIAVPSELAKPGVRIVGISEGAPIWRYATDAIAQLASTMPDPDAFVAAVEYNVASREDNVRAALAKVELDEGDAAFVYVTDALGSERVRRIALPEAVDVSASYAAVQVSDRPLAAAFTAWLGSPAAVDIITAAGFEAAS